jgi:glycosyltransferase involved in cell wall biosynthesis
MSGKLAGAPRVVCFPFVGNLIGGAHISAVNLIAKLDRARYEPLVVLHQPDGPLAALLARHGIAIEAAPTAAFLQGGSPVRDLRVLWRHSRKLVNFLRRREVRIVHTNDGRMHATWALASRSAGARLLWHHRGNPGARGVRFIAPWLAHHVVCVSSFATPTDAWFRRWATCSVVHSPFDTEGGKIDRAACRNALLTEFGLPPHTLVVGFFGNLVPRKRPQAFVETIAMIREQAPDLEVFGPLFGDDLRDTGGAIRARAEALGVAPRTPLMGFRYPPEQWLAACDVLLVPAVQEPFGRTLIEAMLLGTLVIAADSGGNPEAIRDGETGYLVPPDDPVAMAERTVTALRDPAGSAVIAERAHADAMARFGLERHARTLMKIYDRMLCSGCPVCAVAAETQ